jgi:thymidylate kinase
LFPAAASDFFRHETLHGQFLDLAITDNEAWGLLAGALTEIAGNFMHRYMDVMPKLQSGKIVIQETFGLKHLVKDLYLARTVAEKNGNLEFLPLIAKLEELGETIYSNVVAPEVGIVVDGDPDAAIDRRIAQDGRAGWTEDMQLAGDPGIESFRHMQHYTRRIFLDYASRRNWPVLTITDEDKQTSVRRSVDSIINTLLEGRPQAAPPIAHAPVALPCT